MRWIQSFVVCSQAQWHSVSHWYNGVWGGLAPEVKCELIKGGCGTCSMCLLFSPSSSPSSFPFSFLSFFVVPLNEEGGKYDPVPLVAHRYSERVYTVMNNLIVMKINKDSSLCRVETTGQAWQDNEKGVAICQLIPSLRGWGRGNPLNAR